MILCCGDAAWWMVDCLGASLWMPVSTPDPQCGHRKYLLAFVLCRFRCVQLFATLWTVACQGPPSMGFSRQGYQSGFPCPPPGDLSDPGTKPGSPALQADSLLLSRQESPQNVSRHCQMTSAGQNRLQLGTTEFKRLKWRELEWGWEPGVTLRRGCKSFRGHHHHTLCA